ncbi:hypothetical protein M407DRAFT_27941 [Tulasnella calospora MUT 4182]|uniref:F-box domain-containing protein n=1 Tax=Tulasnella calospora MUT 4182 TaxID=1051891 RepID=A0A0C3QBL1_9AGAM|nr:hypothetical protein M407DRAFT_27941 [Tulasnella calospora MUT 4182]
MKQTDIADRDSPVCDAVITVGGEVDVHEFGIPVSIQVQLPEAGASSELELCIKQNAEPPIHSLPPEVFLRIICLHMFLDLGDLRTGYYRRLISLSGVCRYWYNVIRHSPPLWTRIHTSDSSEVVEMALQRSSTHPLDIVLHPQPPTDELLLAVPANFRSILDAIHPHRNRWRSMDILVPSQWMEAVVAGLEDPAPNLERLSFIDRDMISCTREFDLFGEKAPQMNNLTLNGVSVRWDSEVLHNLAILDLSWIRFPSTDAILQTLSHSPHLEKLKIHRCSTMSIATPSSPSIQLLKLSRLEVDLSSEVAAENFLDHIECDGEIILN